MASEGRNPQYTHGHHDSVLRSHRWRTAANSAGYLLPELRPGMSVLDVGCGPGTITIDLARGVNTGRVVGIDSAPAAIEEARRQAGAELVDFRIADLEGSGLEPQSFDVVHAHQVLQHVADPVSALRSMTALCRPGGLVAVRDSDYSAMTWHPASAELDAWLALYQRVARANGGEPDAGRRLYEWAKQAGLLDIRPSASAWCYAEEPDRQWWADLWADRMTKSTIASRALELGFASQSDLAQIADGWRRWATNPSGWFAVLHGEILARAPHPDI
jgi:ubiquinone/menaquinone biosynthesis C-methylase UbiE